MMIYRTGTAWVVGGSDEFIDTVEPGVGGFAVVVVVGFVAMVSGFVVVVGSSSVDVAVAVIAATAVGDDFAFVDVVVGDDVVVDFVSAAVVVVCNIVDVICVVVVVGE